MHMQTITLPQLAKGVTAATVVRWLKQVGDRFAAGEALVELETEEAVVLLEASHEGTLSQILAQARATVSVGAVLAHVAGAAGPAPQSKPEETVAQPPAEPTGVGVSGLAANVTPILMPQAGNTMEEGTVVAWKVAAGDQIRVGQVICEIETDKATIEYETPDGGRLARIVVPDGGTVPIKQPIAYLADRDADVDVYLAAAGGAGVAAASAGVSAAAPVQAVGAAAPAAGRAASGPAPRTAEGRVKASPAARALARERGIDLAALGAGSGPGGRILSEDVPRAGAAPLPSGDGQPVRRLMTKMRRAIGLNLQQSKQTIPHFYLRVTINAEPLFAYYRERKPQTNCTLNDCVVLAVGRAMAECPGMRSQIQGDEIVEYPHANIGIAVGVEDGLVVPVVKRVEAMTLGQLASEARRVVENARHGKLENIGQGNFTITNLGMFGIEEFAAIINPPESAILAVSALRETVIVENGTMRPGRVMTMTLSADHRLVDGLLAAKFLGRLKEILENPGGTLT